MTRKSFVRQLELDHSAEEVFRWHARPGAFARLAPPWEDVRLVTRPARIVQGSTQEISVPLGGPVRMGWCSEITSVVDGSSFEDTQTSGPFAEWVHTHSMQPTENGSVLEDRVAYRLPLGPLGSIFGGGYTRKKLERMFAYRHRITASDLARHRSIAKPMDILITGASGMVGSALSSFLTTGGHRVRSLVRRKPRGEHEFQWDPVAGIIDNACAEGVDAVVHLAGENIAGKRWSPTQKQKLRRSRVEGTRLVANAIRAAKERPSVLVAASAVGFYGDRDDVVLDESSSAGRGFLANLCEAWEAESRQLTGIRAVQLRFGVVLSPAGGALKKMLLPFKMGAGGRIGNGQQWMSWIALDDVVGAIHHALQCDDLQGPVNAVAPNPVTNSEYTRTLGKVLGRPTILPMPAFGARLAFGELANELLLASQRVVPKRLQESGYSFSYPDLEGALRHQLGKS